ncbi:MAG: TIGR01212 family radical SAM protein [Bacteroidetes bacterium]|nr:TIGR01212 family radical SAM protein [Bacteroidota bacterium]
MNIDQRRLNFEVYLNQVGQQIVSNNKFPWGHSRRFNSYSEYIKELFGGRVQKVAVDAGFTCPNRDGSVGTGGCTYCDNEAFNPSYCNPNESITEQIKKGIEFHAKRYRRAKEFLVYFQPFSNTYAPLPVLKEKYQEALSFPGVVGLVIGTRPDCVDDAILDWLAGLAKNHYIQIEYGIESVNEDTLKRIIRGHTFELSKQIIEKTHAMGIRTGAHFILGLPGETPEMMMGMAEIISQLPIDTVKFHQLQIIKGTQLEKEYIANPSSFHLFGLEEYIDFIIAFTERLRPSLVIERFTGEVPPRFLDQYHWGLLRNDEILRMIDARLEERDSWQGKYLAIC